MIRTIDSHWVVVDKVKWFRFCGNSDDTKPTDNVATGSEFKETDTGDKYLYSEATGTWNLSSSGGGGEDDDGMVVHITEESYVETFDTTWKDMNDAYKAGKHIVVIYEGEYEARYGSVISMYHQSESQSGYSVTIGRNANIQTYYTDAETGYPYYSFD